MSIGQVDVYKRQSMNNTGKGAAIGGGSGAALGAILGGVIGKGKGAAIGAAIGTAVGAGTGALIGKKMDKAAAEAKQIEGAQVEQITDNNGLQAVKVTFDSGILFTTGNANLSAAAKSALSKFANNVLNQKDVYKRQILERSITSLIRLSRSLLLWPIREL